MDRLSYSERLLIESIKKQIEIMNDKIDIILNVLHGECQFEIDDSPENTVNVVSPDSDEQCQR